MRIYELSIGRINVPVIQKIDNEVFVSRITWALKLETSTSVFLMHAFWVIFDTEVNKPMLTSSDIKNCGNIFAVISKIIELFKWPFLQNIKFQNEKKSQWTKLCERESDCTFKIERW